MNCPVCGYDKLEFPPINFSICACCGTEFGYDDRVPTHYELRREWIRQGYPWFDPEEPQPRLWNPEVQLIKAGFGRDIRIVDPSRPRSRAKMKRLEIYVAMAVIAFVGLCFEGALTLRQVRSDSHDITLKVDDYIGALKWPTQNALAQVASVGAIAAQIEKKERDSFNQQQKIATKALAVLDSASTTITKLGSAVDQLATVAPVARQAIVRLTDDAGNIADGIRPILTNAGAATAVTAQTINDNLPSIAKNIKDGTAQGNAVAADLHKEGDLIVGKTEKAFAPQNKFLTILKVLSGGTISAAELWYYLSH